MIENEPAAADPNARFVAPADKKAAARKWFEQAHKLVEQRNYDYAIKSFTEGLTLDPDDVENGYVPLRGCAVARKHSGGKKPGMMDGVKFSMTTKDPLKGLINAAWLFAHDPDSASYAEGLLRNANKARCDDALFWIAPVLRGNLGNEKKPQPKKFALLKDICEELGDRCQARGEMDLGIKAYDVGIEALTVQRNIEPTNRELDNVIRDLSTKLTILKGNYQTAGNFRESVLDSGEQAKIHDEERMVQSEERLAELTEDARAEMDANPDVDAKVIAYVDLLCRTENDEREKRAITLLYRKFKQTDKYRFKQRADDIAARQLGRHARIAKKGGDIKKQKQLLRRKLLFEENMFRERVEKYPTDLRVKHGYAKRLFAARKFDEAIPVFQLARDDPKVRKPCELYLGRCFFERGLHSQAVAILEEAIATHDLMDDLAKELNYWLARALEADGKSENASQAYGKLLQIDYNYRDVQGRLEALK